MKFLATPIFCLVSLCAFCQVNSGKLDSLFQMIDMTENGMGTVSISFEGKQVYSNSIGHSNLEQNELANEETKYRIGSLSKTYTATIILKLIEEGQLKLKSKVKRFFPDLPNSNKITIEQLLRHTSGIYNFTNNPAYFSYNDSPISRKDLLKHIIKEKSQFKPGSKFEYSNSNYVLLTFIAEDVSGKPFQNLVNEYILQPLNLTRTSFGGATDSLDNEAFSYSDFGGWERERITDMTVPLGAGAIEASPKQVNEFLFALFNKKILNEKSLKLMQDVQGEWNYGLGVYNSSVGDGTWIGHNGGVDGFQTFGFYHPKSKMGICYISNGSIYPISKITDLVVGIVQNDTVILPKLVSPDEIQEVSIDKYIGIYSIDGFPLKIEIKVKSDSLFAQATGQGEFPLTKVGAGKYQYTPAGVRVILNHESRELVLIQLGQRVVFLKEE